ncbi:Lebercilin domain [Cinara cedri]|uniref:Lebercilin domain n=1 Tax=Cinara cedri TaxID=506608 RepID=A0A5E4M0X8_9HEMI|nr:Lebercilin domain [Cinara cedri]
MNKNNQESVLQSNDEYPYSEEIIGEFVMELPAFNNKKIISASNQQRKKKVLKPLRTHTLSVTRRRQCTSNTPYQTTYTNGTGTHSNKSNMNNLTSNDHILKIKQLENELVEIRMKTRELIIENRLLKTLEKRHEKALSLYEGKQAKLPQVIKTYEEDNRILQNRIRQMKISYNEMENRYKSQSNELIVIQKQHRHLLDLSKNKQLSKREKLSNQLEEAQNIIKEQDNKIQKLMKQLELQNKTHKHNINLENIKIKGLQLEVKRLKNENQNLGSRADGLKTKIYSARQIFSRGVTENSINITPRIVNSESPIQYRQGDGIDKSLYKTNGSLKPELLHGKYEVNNSLMESNIIKESTNPINKRYTSHLPGNISWPYNNNSKFLKDNKPELPSIENNNYENLNEHIASQSIQESFMSRKQKDLLLAKLNQVSEDEDNNYERYYKQTSSLNQSFDERSLLSFSDGENDKFSDIS